MAPVDISSDATKLKAKSGKENICIHYLILNFPAMAPKLKEREFQKNILFLQDPDDD